MPALPATEGRAGPFASLCVEDGERDGRHEVPGRHLRRPQRAFPWRAAGVWICSHSHKQQNYTKNGTGKENPGFPLPQQLPKRSVAEPFAS